MRRLIIISLIITFTCIPSLRAEPVRSNPDKRRDALSTAGTLNRAYGERSLGWHKHNDWLIPDNIERQAISTLNQDYSKPRRHDNDFDGDGVLNEFDPSPYDWREIGYEPFGVLSFLHWHHPWNNYKYNEETLKKTVKILKDLGISFVRFDFLWDDIEPRPGEFQFRKYDFLVDLLTENQIRILGILDYSASWAAPDWNYPPTKIGDFLSFVSVVITRYKDKIKYWEVWNEPDSPFYWKPQDDMKTYSELLKHTYRLAKKIDPSCKVLLGGLIPPGIYALQNIYRNGGKDYFDIINIHPFVNPLYPNRIKTVAVMHKNLKRIMDKFNDSDKKIWFTELGCPGVRRPERTNTWWEGKSPVEREQALWVKEVYSKLLKLEDVEKIFWAFLRDNKKHFKSGVDYFGLIRWNFSKKPAYEAYRKCSRSFKLPN